MRAELTMINPLSHPGWDGMLLREDKGTFFQTAAWARVLNESYGYVPHFLAALDGDAVRALLPVAEVRSALTGRRGVALPFTDYCEPIVGDGFSLKDMIDEAVVYGRGRGWRYLEIRGGASHLGDSSFSSSYYGHTLDLSRDEGALSRGFRDSTRRNIRKAQNEGVKVELSASATTLEDFCRLNALTRREHGLPPQPNRFFRKVYENVLSKGLGIVALASCKGANVAGAVYFHFGGKAIYKYGASDKGFQHLRANNLVMWEAIRLFAREGFRSFCFGRTEPENEGLRQFKTGWGSREDAIRYYRYDLAGSRFVKARSKTSGWHNAVFRNLPLSISRLIGAAVYRHLG